MFSLASCLGCLLNVISYERAYCLYPRATLHERRALLIHPQDGDQWTEILIKNITQRGYEVIEVPDMPELAISTPDVSFVLGWRWIDDSSAWVIDLDTVDVTPPPAANDLSSSRTHDPVAICNFSLRYRAHNRVHMEFFTGYGSPLQFTYVFGDLELLKRLRNVISARAGDGI